MRTRGTLSLAALAAGSLLTAGAALPARRATPGNAADGKALFLRAGIFCGSCHTLRAAKSTGRDGPNLDRVKSSYAQIVAVVTKGAKPTKAWPTGMPGYGGPHGELSPARIRDVAAFVYRSTH